MVFFQFLTEKNSAILPDRVVMEIILVFYARLDYFCKSGNGMKRNPTNIFKLKLRRQMPVFYSFLFAQMIENYSLRSIMDYPLSGSPLKRNELAFRLVIVMTEKDVSQKILWIIKTIMIQVIFFLH